MPFHIISHIRYLPAYLLQLILQWVSLVGHTPNSQRCSGKIGPGEQGLINLLCISRAYSIMKSWRIYAEGFKYQELPSKCKQTFLLDVQDLFCRVKCIQTRLPMQ